MGITKHLSRRFGLKLRQQRLSREVLLCFSSFALIDNENIPLVPAEAAHTRAMLAVPCAPEQLGAEGIES